MNIRTLLNEIKDDYKKYNFKYYEYEDNTKDWERLFVVDQKSGFVYFHYYQKNGGFSGRIPLQDFMEFKSNSDILHIIAEAYYYNYNEY